MNGDIVLIDVQAYSQIRRSFQKVARGSPKH